VALASRSIAGRASKSPHRPPALGLDEWFPLSEHGTLRNVRTWTGTILLVLALPWIACGDPSAALGSVFADTYSSLSPLVTLHHRYAEFLFQGTTVVVPDGLDAACESFGIELGRLHIELSVQTASDVGAVLTEIIHLRSHTAAFCDGYQGLLMELGESTTVDPALLEQSADAEMFSSISEIDRRFAELLETMMDALGLGESRWRFAVAFSLRTILNQEPLERIDGDLASILYGGEARDTVPYAVSESTGEAMSELVTLAGRELAADEQSKAAELAAKILDAFMDKGLGA